MTEPLDLDAIEAEWQSETVRLLCAAVRERDAEIARLRAPPGADVMERARRMIANATRKRPGWTSAYLDLDEISRALQQYGDERAAAAIEVCVKIADRLTAVRAATLIAAEIRALAAKPGSKT